MIVVSKTKIPSLIKKIISNPSLWYLSGNEGDSDNYELTESDEWLLMTENNVIIGLMQLCIFTEITKIGHIWILPKYQGSNKPKECVSVIKEFLITENKIKSVITTVPIDCKHVISLMTKTKFTCQGVIKNGINYHNKIQDIILFQLELRG